MKRFGAYQRRLVLTRGSTLKTSRTAPLINPEFSAFNLWYNSFSNCFPLLDFSNNSIAVFTNNAVLLVSFDMYCVELGFLHQVQRSVLHARIGQ